jgi:prevent-host-death family protein
MTIQIVPITEFRKESKNILHGLNDTPVILTQRSRPVAVLIEYDKYQEQEERIRYLELMVDDLVLAHAIETAEDFVSVEDLFADNRSS